MSDLFGVKETQYGEQYKNHVLEQYKLFVQSAENISDLRQAANRYFITVNTALISFIGLCSQIKGFENAAWVKALIAFFGIVICVVFWFLIRSYKQLNTAKFSLFTKLKKLCHLLYFVMNGLCWEKEGMMKNISHFLM